MRRHGLQIDEVQPFPCTMRHSPPSAGIAERAPLPDEDPILLGSAHQIDNGHRHRAAFVATVRAGSKVGVGRAQRRTTRGFATPHPGQAHWSGSLVRLTCMAQRRLPTAAPDRSGGLGQESCIKAARAKTGRPKAGPTGPWLFPLLPRNLDDDPTLRPVAWWVPGPTHARMVWRAWFGARGLVGSWIEGGIPTPAKSIAPSPLPKRALPVHRFAAEALALRAPLQGSLIAAIARHSATRARRQFRR
jgi:hypothetical protein